MAAEVLIKCKYCGHEAPLSEMREVNAGPGGLDRACKDIDACDERDAKREAALEREQAEEVQ